MSNSHPLLGPIQVENGFQIAMESSSRIGSIAILDGPKVVFQQVMGVHQRTASEIGPAIQAAMDFCQSEAKSIEIISIADGPGSFTGLRIGVTAAKTLSYALRIPLVAVDSLASIAAAVFTEFDSIDSVLVALDAYRGQVYAGRFERSKLLVDLHAIPASWDAHPAGVDIVESSEWKKILQSIQIENLPVAGDVKPFQGVADPLVLTRTVPATGVGMLALRARAAGQWSDPFTLVPRYLRASAAEEQANQAKR